MDFKKLALCAALGGAMVGCGSNTTTGEGPEMTYTYVAARISIPAAEMGTTEVPGFDLDDQVTDGSDTADCETASIDFTYNGTPGIDNALANLVPTLEGVLGNDLDMTIQEQVASGDLILLMEVRANSLTTDTTVPVRFILGTVPEGTMPMVDGSGALAAGQTFGQGMVLGSVMGSIAGGVLTASAPDLTLNIETTDLTIELVIRNAEVRGNITATALANGVIGGSLLVDDIVAAIRMFMPMLEMTARNLLNMQADITPSSADPAICNALSVGITFSGVTATLGS